jgi:hypothetical protein
MKTAVAPGVFENTDIEEPGPCNRPIASTISDSYVWTGRASQEASEMTRLVLR